MQDTLEKSKFSSKIEQDGPYVASYPSRDFGSRSYLDREDGQGDDEIEEFLCSRVKHGRGAIGSRMDGPVPYLTSHCTSLLQFNFVARDASMGYVPEQLVCIPKPRKNFLGMTSELSNTSQIFF